MRLVWKTENHEFFEKFCRFLDAKQVGYTAEQVVNHDWSDAEYGVTQFLLWTHDEDQLDEVREWLEVFQKDPESFVEKTPEKEVVSKPITRESGRPIHIVKGETNRRRPRLTTWILLLCVSIFLFEAFFTKKDQVPSSVQSSMLSTSPIKRKMLIDYPHTYELLDKVINLYGYNVLLHPNLLPQSGRLLYEEYKKEPVWNGVYPILVAKSKKRFSDIDEPLAYTWENAPLFEKVSEGEVWRLITPAFLHGGILHIFFNMVWVLILGSQIEFRLGPLRYLLLIVLLAIISNAAQYLMSGANFIGFSGVIAGMAAFMWTRKKKAPWEGYLLSKSTFQFLAFFVLTLAFLSFMSFGLAVFADMYFPVAIANTAHIGGALAGFILGRWNVFAWQVNQE